MSRRSTKQTNVIKKKTQPNSLTTHHIAVPDSRRAWGLSVAPDITKELSFSGPPDLKAKDS